MGRRRGPIVVPRVLLGKPCHGRDHLSPDPRSFPQPPSGYPGQAQLGVGGQCPAPMHHLAVLGPWWQEFRGSGGPGAPEGLSADPSLQQQAPPEQAQPQGERVFLPLPLVLHNSQLPNCGRRHRDHHGVGDAPLGKGWYGAFLVGHPSSAVGVRSSVLPVMVHHYQP